MIRLILLLRGQESAMQEREACEALREALSACGLSDVSVSARYTGAPEEALQRLSGSDDSHALYDWERLYRADEAGIWREISGFRWEILSDRQKRNEELLLSLHEWLVSLRDFGVNVHGWSVSSDGGARIQMDSVEAAECARRLLQPEAQGIEMIRVGCILRMETAEESKKRTELLVKYLTAEQDI